MKKLTPKQQRFVAEYLIDMNATQAAIRAGYSEKTAQEIGAQNLSKLMVATAIAEAQAARSERTEITQDRVLKEYARIAFSDMRAFAKWGPDGVSLIESDQLPEDAALCVAEVTETTTQHGGSIKFKLHDKRAALDSLAKHLGMFQTEDDTSKQPDFVPLEDRLAGYLREETIEAALNAIQIAEELIKE